MEKRKRMEIPLPEAMIQHIQSFLTTEEAARTTVLSKSWYAAWLTRPSLEFDWCRFMRRNQGQGPRRRSRSRSRLRPFQFLESVMATLRRYEQSNLNIESFTLRTDKISGNSGKDLGFAQVLHDLSNLASAAVAMAVKLGATNLVLDFDLASSPLVVLPEEVLLSDTLVRLSVRDCKIEGKVKWSKLKSLKLERVHFKNGDNAIRNIVSCCGSIEDLSISYFVNNLTLSRKNLCKLHKLKRLILTAVGIDNSFFDAFDSRFPCLTDLSLDSCHGYSEITFSSTSLQRMSTSTSTKKVFEFQLMNLPNLAYFSYRGVNIPSITIEAAETREWDSHINLMCDHCQFSISWYLEIKKLLNQLSESRINLSLCNIGRPIKCDGIIKDEGEAVAVESLTVNSVSCDWGYKILYGLFSICRPKFVAHDWLPLLVRNNASLENLMEEVREQRIFGELDIEGVKVEVYEAYEVYQGNIKEWRRLVLKEPLDFGIAPSKIRQVRLQLKWR